MQIMIPPGPSLTTAYMSLSPAEATGLRDALDLMLTTGSSGWHVTISLGDYETDLTLILEADGGPTPLPNAATSA
jgi:hypothetical protein